MAHALNIDNLPTPKEEMWKYTNLPRAVPQGLKAQDPDEKIIHIKQGITNEQPVDIVWTSESGNIYNPRLSVELEDNASLTLIETNQGVGKYWKNATTTIKLGKNARLTHIRIGDDSGEAVNTNMVSLTTDRDAVYNGFALNMGGALTRHDIHATLNGENAEISFNGLNLLSGDQHGDTTILIEHAAPHCRSNQFYRTILDDKARGVFQGKVHVHQIAQKTDGYQLSNAILLSDKARWTPSQSLKFTPMTLNARMGQRQVS